MPYSTRLCLSASSSRPDFVFQAKTRGQRASHRIVDTTTVHHKSSRNLACSRLPVLQIQTELLSSTSVRRRCLLLQFMLQMTILPPISDDSNARISETCFDSLPCNKSEFAMKTSCHPCQVPSGRVVHPVSVYVITTGE